MSYIVPNLGFDAAEHARNKVIRSNQFEETVFEQFIAVFVDFWGLEPGGGSRYSTEEMQSILDAMPQSTAIDIMTDASAFRSFLNQAYPGKLEEKYNNPVWTYSIVSGRVVLGELVDAWKPPEPEPEEETP